MRTFPPSLVYVPAGAGRALLSRQTDMGTVYRDEALTIVEANLQLAAGSVPVPDGRILIDASSRTPRLQLVGDGVTKLWVLPDDSVIATPLFADAEEVLAFADGRYPRRRAGGTSDDAATVPFENAGDWEADNTGATSATAALQAAANAALAAVIQAGVGGQTTAFACKLVVPPGRYRMDTPVVLTIPAGHGLPSWSATYLANAIVLTVEANGATFFHPEGSTETLFKGYGVRLNFKDAIFQGCSTTNDDCLWQFGSDAQDVPLNQSVFDHCMFVAGGVQTRYAWAFDIAFRDCIWSNPADGGVCEEVLEHPSDNCNNIHHFRCHFEAGTVPESLVRATNDGSGSRVHHSWGYHACHFETQIWGPMLFDIEQMRGLHFTGVCQFTQRGGLGGVAGDAGPMFRLLDTTVVGFDTADIDRGAGTSTKMFQLGGDTNLVALRGSYVFPGDPVYSKDDLWEDIPGQPLTVRSTPLSMPGCNIGGLSGANMSDEVTAWTNASGFQRWTARMTSALAMIFGYSNAQDTWANGRLDTLKLEPDGTVGLLLGALSGQQQTIADTVTGTFTMGAANNTNRRGIYMVTANGPNSYFGVFFSDGANLTAIATGTQFAMASADPGTASKVNVFIGAGGTIKVRNLTGSSKIVNVVQLAGFRA